MKKISLMITILFLIMLSAITAHSDLNNFLSDLNIQANADINGFGVKLSTRFDIPLPNVQAIIKTVEFPADAFMCLQLSHMTNTKPEIVVQTYRKNKKKGWGAIAKELGIKPGSNEFHALKRGEFSLIDDRGGNANKGQNKSKNKGKEKGHKKK